MPWSPALVTKELICLQASAIEFNTTASSFVTFPFISCFSSQVVKVVVPTWSSCTAIELGASDTAAFAFMFPFPAALHATFLATEDDESEAPALPLGRPTAARATEAPAALAFVWVFIMLLGLIKVDFILHKRR